MSTRFKFLVIFFVVLLGGCTHVLSSKIADNSEASDLKAARVFQREILAKGGNLLVVPFSAGVGIKADAQLDRVSLMIVKGVADTIGSGDQPFKLLVAGDAQNADLVIKGQIIQLDTKGFFPKPWQKRKNQFTLSIEGSILGVEPEQILAQFSQTKTLESQDNSFDSLGYDVGVAIGKFLLKSSNQ